MDSVSSERSLSIAKVFEYKSTSPAPTKTRVDLKIAALIFNQILLALSVEKPYGVEKKRMPKSQD